jgi:hypothetical protein
VGRPFGKRSGGASYQPCPRVSRRKGQGGRASCARPRGGASGSAHAFAMPAARRPRSAPRSGTPGVLRAAALPRVRAGKPRVCGRSAPPGAASRTAPRVPRRSTPLCSRARRRGRPRHMTQPPAARRSREADDGTLRLCSTAYIPCPPASSAICGRRDPPVRGGATGPTEVSGPHPHSACPGETRRPPIVFEPVRRRAARGNGFERRLLSTRSSARAAPAVAAGGWPPARKSAGRYRSSTSGCGC